MMDKCYAQRRNGNYDYNIYNYTTSHVPTMLSIALMKMMAKTECVLFVDSDNSIKYQKGQSQTLSPWIYEEISLAQNYSWQYLIDIYNNWYLFAKVEEEYKCAHSRTDVRWMSCMTWICHNFIKVLISVMAILAVRLLTTYIMKHLRNTNVEPIEALSMIKYVFKEDDIRQHLMM